MKPTTYIICYAILLAVLGVKLVGNLSVLGQGVAQGNHIAQLKYKQRQLQLRQQQLEQSIAEHAAMSKAAATENHQQFISLNQLEVISDSGLALSQ